MDGARPVATGGGAREAISRDEAVRDAAAGVGSSLRVTLLLWLPLPFYVYSISYGSVPIFIPQLYPHSFYNSRYGLEMLPGLALFGAVALAGWAARLRAWNPVAGRLLAPVAAAACVVNCLLMVHATPLVLHEAEVNSVGRIAIEKALAQQLDAMTPGAPIMMNEGTYVGALQQAGIPLRQVVQPDDYYKGLTLPSEKAAYVVAIGDDSVSQAVKAHPEGLTETTIVCSSGQPCARVYASDRFR